MNTGAELNTSEREEDERVKCPHGEGLISDSVKTAETRDGCNQIQGISHRQTCRMH